MLDPLIAWRAEHAQLAGLLQFLDQYLDALRSGREPHYAVVRDVVYYLQHVADKMHHAREDQAFQRAVALDPSLEIPVNRLLQEHRVIFAAGESLLDLLDSTLRGMPARWKIMEAAIAMYLVYYHHHLAKEESEILPRVARLLTPEDWTAIATAVPSRADPEHGITAGAPYRERCRDLIEQGEA